MGHPALGDSLVCHPVTDMNTVMDKPSPLRPMQLSRRPRPISSPAALLAVAGISLGLGAWWLWREEAFPAPSGKAQTGQVTVQGDNWVVDDPLLPAPLVLDPLDWLGQDGSPRYFDRGAAPPPPPVPPKAPRGLADLPLHLVWPSLHVSPGDHPDTFPCAPTAPGTRVATVAQPCPALHAILTFADRHQETPAFQASGKAQVLASQGWHFWQRLRGHPHPHLTDNQQQVPFAQRQVTQWMAFYTRGRDFAGWLCDDMQLAQTAARVGTWGAEADLWAVPPTALAQQTCLTPSQWDLMVPSRLGGLRQHVVLWHCQQPIEAAPASWRPDSQSCTAEFLWGNYVVALHLPNEPAIHSRQPSPPPLASPASAYTAALRPRMVEAAWQTLNQGLSGQPTPPTPTAAARLAQELTWCARIQEADRQIPPASPQDSAALALQHLGRRDEYQVDRGIHPGSVCSRALHRLLARIDGLPPGMAPPSDLMDTLQRLADATRRGSAVPDPLLRGGQLLIARQSGEDSLPALRWLSRRDYYADGNTVKEMLDRYDRLQGSIDPLPPAERLRIRYPLASGMQYQQAFSQAPEGDRYGERLPALYAATVTDWQQAPAHTLSPLDEAQLLVSAARYARARSTSAPGEGVSRAALAELLPILEKQAKDFLQDTRLPVTDRVTLAGRVAVNAAWTANALAIGQAPGGMWQTWLTQWANWAEGAFPPYLPTGATTTGDTTLLATRIPQILHAIAAHRDAAAQGENTVPDCPGARWMQCMP